MCHRVVLSSRCLLVARYHTWELINCTAACTHVPLQIFAVDFLSCCHLESLIMGNVTAAEALALCRDLADIINTPPAAAAAAAGAAGDEQMEGTADAVGDGGDDGGDGGGSSSSSRLVLDVAERPVEVCVQLPGGVEVLRVEPTRNPEEDNCCVEVYYQVNTGQGLACLVCAVPIVRICLDSPGFKPCGGVLPGKLTATGWPNP
jgi:hypothetical protein